jgi:hypothetical protein
MIAMDADVTSCTRPESYNRELLHVIRYTPGSYN